MVAWLDLEREIEQIYKDTRSKTMADYNGNIEDILSEIDKYGTNEGKIDRRKLSRILDKVDEKQRKQARDIFDDTTEGMSLTTKATALFLVANVGVITNEAEYNAMEEIALTRWLDDINLRDRTSILAGQQADEIRNIVRQGVYRDTPLSEVRQQVRDKYVGDEWKVDRIVESEVYNTHRLQFGKTARESGLQYVQFNEFFPASKNRERHECYTYAREDNYGKGQGIFHIDDDKIYSPHPRCTGYLSIPSHLQNVEGGDS